MLNKVRILSKLYSRKLFGRKIFKNYFKSGLLACRPYSCNTGMDIYNKFSLPAKFQGFDKNVWVEYILLNNEYKPVNLGQGFPDFSPPSFVKEALKETCQSEDPLIHQYTRSPGHPRLVKAIANLYSKCIGREIDPMTEVIVGVGAYEILFMTMVGHLQEGDEAIVIEPFFDCYYPMIKITGAKPVFIPLMPAKGSKGSSTKDWVLDDEELEKAFNSKTKLIIVNTPHNPVGKVFTEEELTKIANLCKKWNVLCISDEVYEWMVIKPNKHVRMASLDGMWERTITIGSAGKAFSVTGWKIGWGYGPAPLLKNLQVVHQNCVYTCSTVVQEAVAKAFEREIEVLGKPESFFEQIKAELEPKRDFMVKALKDMGMEPVVPDGGYFIFANYSPLLCNVDLSEEKDPEKDYKFTKWMVKKVGVLAIPPSVFYCEEHKNLGEDYVRFCIIKQDEVLQKAAERLRKWKESLK